ncbi:14792_t:CDS:2 [Entrophospora sp. SA101]|nr:14792_t:CDS:2 [Entrophospora sp. SA101]
MAPIHTLNSGSTVAENFQGRGYKLDSTRERELESERNELLIKTEFFANKCSDFRNAKVLAETRSDELAKELKSKNEKILRLRKKLNRITDAKTRNDSNMKQLKEEIKQLQSENTNLVSQGALKELSLTGYQTDELEHLKSEDISEPTVGGDNEKNTQSDEQSPITKSDDISAISEESVIRGYASPSKNLSQYFIHKKNMDQAGKIDTIVPDHTDDKSTSIPEKSVIRGYDSYPSVDTEIIPNVSDKIDISKTNNNILVQPENNMSPLIESNTQMGPGPEALPPPIGAIPIVAYIFLTLLIIAVMCCKEPSSPLYTDCIVTHSFMVVGMRFRGGHKFKKSDTITLEPEPSNTYDKNAIKIMVDGTHKAYVAKDENVSIGDLMKKYPNYRITAHGKKNYNKSASLNLEYPWMVCERCCDTLQASRDYDYSYW